MAVKKNKGYFKKVWAKKYATSGEKNQRVEEARAEKHITGGLKEQIVEKHATGGLKEQVKEKRGIFVVAGLKNCALEYDK